MTAALVLGQPLAGAVVALMYSGGNVLRKLRSLVPSMICARWWIALHAKATPSDRRKD